MANFDKAAARNERNAVPVKNLTECSFSEKKNKMKCKDFELSIIQDKSKILKLAKRLGKFTVDEIIPILMIAKEELMLVLGELTAENKVIKRDDGAYFYKEIKNKKQKLPLFFEFRTKEELDLIIKSFCADVEFTKIPLITGLSENIICKFHKYFRKNIFEQQKTELEKHFKKSPQQYRSRNFYGKLVFFYFYYDKLYITDKPYDFNLKYKKFTKDEIKIFKALYCKINRFLSHNTRQKLLSCHIAEFIWRNNKPFDTLVQELYLLLK